MRRLRFPRGPNMARDCRPHPPGDAPAGEIIREGTQIDLNQVGRTRQKRGVHSRIDLPGALHLRFEVTCQKAIGAPIVADGIRLELPLQKRSNGGFEVCGHHTGGGHSAQRLAGG
jgi:hypothetical protein